MVDILNVTLALFALVIAASLLARRISVPEPLLFVLTCLVLSFVPGVPVLSLDPELVLDVFLPLLVYAAAIALPWQQFRENLRPIGFLGIGLVVFTTFGVAVLAHSIVPGLSWPACFALGAIVSPPDVVAPAAMLSRLPIPQRLAVILKGEGLVNDVTALTIFRFAVLAAISGSFSIAHTSFFFLAAYIGGTLYGIAVGWAALAIRRYLDDPRLEVTVSLITPFVAYLVPEQFGSTGVLAAAVAGLVVNAKSPKMISAQTRLHALPVWAMIDFWLNSLLFLLLGLQMKGVVSSVAGGSMAEAIMVAGAVGVAIVVLRFVWVYLAVYSRWLWRHKGEAEAAPRRNQVFLISWIGIRGAVSLAAALSLPLTLGDGKPFPERDLIIFVTFAVILLTLVAQGASLPFVIRMLGIDVEGRKEREKLAASEYQARIETMNAGIARLEELRQAGEIPEEVSERHRRQLEQFRRTVKRQLAGREDPASGDIARREMFAMAEIVAAQRRKLLELRGEGKIDDEIMHRIERDLDEHEARLQGQEQTLGA